MEFHHAPASFLCTTKDHFVEVLRGQHGEVPIMQGIVGNGKAMFELWANNGESWSATLSIVTPDHGALMCLIASGTDLIRIMGEIPGVPL
jgi:hypothetical protein